jgi:hypothetical protein
VRSYILYDASSPKNVRASVAKFVARFGERVLPMGGANADGRTNALRELAPALRAHRIGHCYIIKFGHPDEPNTRFFNRDGGSAGGNGAGSGKTGGGGGEGSGGGEGGASEGGGEVRTRVLVHAVFDARTPHGDAYARTLAAALPSLRPPRPWPCAAAHPRLSCARVSGMRASRRVCLRAAYPWYHTLCAGVRATGPTCAPSSTSRPTRPFLVAMAATTSLTFSRRAPRCSRWRRCVRTCTFCCSTRGHSCSTRMDTPTGARSRPT